MAPSLLALVSSLAILAPLTSGSTIPGFTPLVKRAPGDFGYSDARGPVNWWNLNPAQNELCAKGRNQSPININPGGSGITTVTGGSRPTFNYPPVNSVKWENVGSTVEALVSGSLTFGGVGWTLQNFHFHTPSEHRLSEEHYPLEVHFVHQRNDPLPDGTRPNLVVGGFFQLGTDDEVVDTFRQTLGRVEEIRNTGSSVTINRLNFDGVTSHFSSNNFYQYAGSLTTPPCSQGVTWLVSNQPFRLNVRLYNSVKSVVKFNSRFVQNVPGQENVIDLAANLFCPA